MVGYGSLVSGVILLGSMWVTFVGGLGFYGW